MNDNRPPRHWAQQPIREGGRTLHEIRTAAEEISRLLVPMWKSVGPFAVLAGLGELMKHAGSNATEVNELFFELGERTIALAAEGQERLSRLIAKPIIVIRGD